MMYFSKSFILCVALFYFCDGAFGDDCNDCIFIKSCPEAMDLILAKKKDVYGILRNAHCGFGVINGKAEAKVCCSAVAAEIALASEVVDDIETHSNLVLLPTSCGEDRRDRTIRGKFTKLYDYPWMAIVFKKDLEIETATCTGTIINSRYILTVGSCVANRRIVRVRIGDHDVSSALDCEGQPPTMYCENRIQEIPIEKIIIHENLTRLPEVKNDIALIRLQTPINISVENAAPICLPVTKALRNINLGDRRATIVGWAYVLNKQKGTDPTKLQELNSPILNNTECLQKYVKNDQICVGGTEDEKCIADGGSPLMLSEMYNGYNRLIQFGSLSFGPTMCNNLLPEVYTDIRKYMKWILDNIEA